jgi:hypothetical protein
MRRMAPLKYQYGRLSSRQPSAGIERGREDWRLTRHPDGSRTMRVLALVDDGPLMRDVTYSLDPGGRPTDVYLRLQLTDRAVGTGYFHLDGETLEAVTWSAAAGRARQTLRVPPRFQLITHAVMLDGWVAWAGDLGARGEQRVTAYHAATSWQGPEGPLGRLVTLRLISRGEETITVPAGTFKAHRIRLEADQIPDLPVEFWVAGKDHLLVKSVWPRGDREYLLVTQTADPLSERADQVSGPVARLP